MYLQRDTIVNLYDLVDEPLVHWQPVRRFVGRFVRRFVRRFMRGFVRRFARGFVRRFVRRLYGEL